MAKPKRRESVGQTIGGVLFGFEQQVLRTTPPPQELVHHARPDLPVPTGDGTLLTISLPDDGVVGQLASAAGGPPEPALVSPDAGHDDPDAR